jgi:uncharacterized protein (TIGR02466 family)
MIVCEIFPTIISINSIEIKKHELQKLFDLSEDQTNLITNQAGNYFHKETYILDTILKNSKLAKDIIKCIDEYVINILGEDPCITYTQSWININPTGTYHHKHCHRNSILSGVLYLQTDKNSGNFRVHRDDDRLVSNETKNLNKFNFSQIFFEPKNFDLFLFPSNLMHSVDENKSEKPRLSLSFNTFYAADIKMDTERLSDLKFSKLVR